MLTVWTVLTVWMLTMWTKLTPPLVLVLCLDTVAGYCAGLGANPGFRGPPKVEQVRENKPVQQCNLCESLRTSVPNCQFHIYV